MTFQGDPYRTLGIAPGASLNEIRSAYRRLAKQFHPDAAGERALPRFLAIQAAYERLVDGEGRLRARAGGGSSPRRGSGSGPEPWRADSARARASRDAWRARRSGGGAGSESGVRGAAGAGRDAPPKRDTPPRRDAPGTRPPGERHHRARRGPRTATPGSTTYDEAAETPLDPAWDGGAWYGPTSGTYWTLNPREYADPRKHGPEYLARARRAAGEDAAGPGPAPTDGRARRRDPDAPPRTEGGEEEGEWAWTGSGATTTDGGAAEWGTRAWTYHAPDPGTAWTPGHEARAREAGHRRHDARRATPPADAPPLPDLEALARKALPEHLLALAHGPDRRWRLLLALVAWPPIGYAISASVSGVTGCARFSAACPDLVPIGLILVQPLLVALLFALPTVAAAGAFAALAALAMAVPAGTVLSVGALPRPIVEPAILGVIVGTTYAIALGAATVRLWRRPPARGRGP